VFDSWRDFYLLIGSAAAVLIGLIFVVISLMQDRPRSTVLAGTRLYMGPIVLGVSFILVISAAATTPGMGHQTFAAIVGVVAVWGLVRGLMSLAGIARRRGSDDPPHWTDPWFYGVFPSALYIVLGAIAAAFRMGSGWAAEALAAALTAGLLLAIRNEWDLITWITPREDSSGDAGHSDAG
jgi:hypothetical protein